LANLQPFRKDAIWPLKTRSYFWALNRARFAEEQDKVHEEEGQPADDEARLLSYKLINH
jgi:hypothetical protein